MFDAFVNSPNDLVVAFSAFGLNLEASVLFAFLEHLGQELEHNLVTFTSVNHTYNTRKTCILDRVREGYYTQK